MKNIIKIYLVLFVLVAFSAPVMGANWSEYTNGTANVAVSDSEAFTPTGGSSWDYHEGYSVDFVDYLLYDHLDSIDLHSSVNICNPASIPQASFTLSRGATGGGQYSCRWYDPFTQIGGVELRWTFDSSTVFTAQRAEISYHDIVTDDVISPISANGVWSMGGIATIGGATAEDFLFMAGALSGDYVTSASSFVKSNYSFRSIVNDTVFDDMYELSVDKIGATSSTWITYNASNINYYTGATDATDFYTSSVIDDGVYAKVSIAGGAYKIISLLDAAGSEGSGASSTPIITYYNSHDYFNSSSPSPISMSQVGSGYVIQYNAGSDYDPATYRYFTNHKYPNGTLMFPASYIIGNPFTDTLNNVPMFGFYDFPAGVYSTTLYRVPLAGGDSELIASSQLSVVDTIPSVVSVDITLDKNSYAIGDNLNYIVNFTNYDGSSTYLLSIHGSFDNSNYDLGILTGNTSGSFELYSGIIPGSYTALVYEISADDVITILDTTSQFTLIDYFDTTEAFINATTSSLFSSDYVTFYGFAPADRDYRVKVILIDYKGPTRLAPDIRTVYDYSVTGYFNDYKTLNSGWYRAELYYVGWSGLEVVVDFANINVVSDFLDIGWYAAGDGDEVSAYVGCNIITGCARAYIHYTNVTADDVIEIISPNGQYMIWTHDDYPYINNFMFPRGASYEGEWIARITNSSNSSDFVISTVKFGNEGNSWEGGLSSATLNWQVLADDGTYENVNTARASDTIVLAWTSSNITPANVHVYSSSVEYLNDSYMYTSGTIPMSFSRTDHIIAEIVDDVGFTWARAELDLAGTGGGIGGGTGGGFADPNDPIYEEGKVAPNVLIALYWLFGLKTSSQLLAAAFITTMALGGIFAYNTENAMVTIIVMVLSMAVHTIFQVFPLSLMLITLAVIAAFGAKNLADSAS